MSVLRIGKKRSTSTKQILCANTHLNRHAVQNRCPTLMFYAHKHEKKRDLSSCLFLLPAQLYNTRALKKLEYKQSRYCTWLQLPTVSVHEEKQRAVTFDFMFPAEHLFHEK